jgi:hypothetical protein
VPRKLPQCCETICCFAFTKQCCKQISSLPQSSTLRWGNIVSLGRRSQKITNHKFASKEPRRCKSLANTWSSPLQLQSNATDMRRNIDSLLWQRSWLRSKNEVSHRFLSQKSASWRYGQTGATRCPARRKPFTDSSFKLRRRKSSWRKHACTFAIIRRTLMQFKTGSATQ